MSNTSDTRETAPAWKAPPLACDSHFHVFGSAERYPYSTDLRYKPPLASLADYLGHARAGGFERFVFVQPSAYGRDNACMIDAMREIGTAVCRGIVDVDENVPEAELARLNALGVRGNLGRSRCRLGRKDAVHEFALGRPLGDRIGFASARRRFFFNGDAT